MPLQVTSPNSLLHHVVALGAIISLVCALSRVNRHWFTFSWGVRNRHTRNNRKCFRTGKDGGERLGSRKEATDFMSHVQEPSF